MRKNPGCPHETGDCHRTRDVERERTGSARGTLANCQPLYARAFYSLANTRTPFLIGVNAEIISIVCAILLMKPLGVAGLALATSIVLLLLLLILRHTTWLGASRPLDQDLRRRLWWRGGLSLAIYIVTFNWALRYTSASHVALYLGASPVWALMWEHRPARSWSSFQRYAAALLALTGVFVLFSPALMTTNSRWLGELLGFSASVLWTNFGRQSRVLGAAMSGAEVTAHTMWRAGVLLMIPAGAEIAARTSGSEHFDPHSLARGNLLLIQLYCIVAGGVAAFAIWNNALRRWPASQVYLFNNLIPLSTMSWAHFCLGEPVTHTFWIAMVLIVAGVVLGQTNWQKLLAPTALPPE